MMDLRDHATSLVLLRAILDQPSDDTPRLVLADWLEENGDPDRAEFIRAQCWLANATKPKSRCSRKRRDRRALSVLHTIDEARLWCPPLELNRGHDYQSYEEIASGVLRIGLATGFGSVTFYRGFVDRIVFPWRMWKKHHQDILALHPVVEVCLTALPRLTHRFVGGMIFYGLPGFGPPQLRVAHEPGPLTPRDRCVIVDQLLKIQWRRLHFILPETEQEL